MKIPHLHTEDRIYRITEHQDGTFDITEHTKDMKILGSTHESFESATAAFNDLIEGLNNEL